MEFSREFALQSRFERAHNATHSSGPLRSFRDHEPDAGTTSPNEALSSLNQMLRRHDNMLGPQRSYLLRDTKTGTLDDCGSATLEQLLDA